MSIHLDVHDVTQSIQGAYDFICNSDATKHSDAFDSVRLDGSYEATDSKFYSSMQTFLYTELGMMCDRMGGTPYFLKGTNSSSASQTRLTIALEDLLGTAVKTTIHIPY